MKGFIILKKLDKALFDLINVLQLYAKNLKI